MINKMFFCGLMVLALTGCSSLRKDDDCPLSKGIACQSLKTVDRMADNGYFDEKELTQRAKTQWKTLNSPVYSNPNHVSGRVMKIWFSPYVDGANNFHDESTVYAVIDEGHWQGKSVKEQVA